MNTRNDAVWDELFREIPPKDLIPFLMKIYWELAEYKLGNPEKLNSDDVVCLYSLRQVIMAITEMEKEQELNS